MSQNDRSPLINGILDDIRRLGPFASIDEINRRLADQAHAYNTQPQADLGGLSPLQMEDLLRGDWSTAGALRLDASLNLDDVGPAQLLADARTLLQFVLDHGPIKETSAGNLPRRAVQALLPQLRTAALDEYERPPTVNEGDVLWLVVLRHTLLFAKLLVRRRGVTVSTKGRSLLEERRAGALYALLFETFFRSFDLRFLDNSDRHPGLQPTVAYTFYRLQTEARDWSSPQSLAERAWHPDAKDPPTYLDQQYGDLRHWSFTQRVLTPLVQFGLVERRLAEQAAPPEEHVYRIAPLFSRFIQFRFSGRQPSAV